MDGSRYITPFAYAYRPTGAPIPGALLNFYINGSSTRSPTYSDEGLTTPNTNPVVADATGTFPDIFLDPTIAYKVVLTFPPQGILSPVVVWTAENVISDNISVLALPTGAIQIGFQQDGAGSVPTTVAAQVKEHFSLSQFGASMNNINDDYIPLTNAIAAAAAHGERELFIPGNCYIGSTVNINNPIELTGYGSGQAGANAGKTQLRFANGINGIVINTATTSPVAGQVGGDGSKISGLMLIGDQSVSATTSGILSRARAILQDVGINYFGYGIQFNSSDIGDGKNGNCNGWVARDCFIQACALDGFRTAGADANAGYGIGLDIAGCGGWGINNESFLANTFIACQAAACGVQARAGLPFAGVNYNDGTNFYAYVATRGATPAQLIATTPGTNGNIWTLFQKSTISFFPVWSNTGSYLPGGSYSNLNLNAATVFYSCYGEGGQAPGQLSQSNTQGSGLIFGLHANGFTTSGMQMSGEGMSLRVAGGFITRELTGTSRFAGFAIGLPGNGSFVEVFDPVSFPSELIWGFSGTDAVIRAGSTEIMGMTGATSGTPNYARFQKMLLPALGNFANDSAAATGGVPVSGVYRNGSILMVRVS